MRVVLLIWGILSLMLATAAFAAEPEIVSRYIQPDGVLQFIFRKDGAGIGYTDTERRRREAKGEFTRDGVFAASFADCSTPRIRCVTLDDVLVFAIDEQAFLQEKPYEARGTKFVPSCTSVTRPPKCGMGSVTFSNSKTRGFFLVSLLDGVLVIGLDQYPPSELEEVYILELGRKGLLHQ